LARDARTERTKALSCRKVRSPIVETVRPETLCPARRPSRRHARTRLAQSCSCSSPGPRHGGSPAPSRRTGLPHVQAVAEDRPVVVRLNLPNGPAIFTDLEVPNGVSPTVELVASRLRPTTAEEAARHSESLRRAHLPLIGRRLVGHHRFVTVSGTAAYDGCTNFRRGAPRRSLLLTAPAFPILVCPNKVGCCRSWPVGWEPGDR